MGSGEVDLGVGQRVGRILGDGRRCGKWAGHSNKKIGNHHLKWAIKEAAILMLRESDQAKAYVAKLERKYNKGKALGIFNHKLGRAIYFMLKNKKAFDMKQFFDQ